MNTNNYPRDHALRMQEWQQAAAETRSRGLQAFVRKIVKARLLEYSVSHDLHPDQIVDAALTEWFQKRGF